MDVPMFVRTIDKNQDMQLKMVALPEQFDAITDITTGWSNISKDPRQCLFMLQEREELRDRTRREARDPQNMSFFG